jgi:hypothetical protein
VLRKQEREIEIEMCLEERKVHQEVRMTVNLIKMHKSRTTDKNEWKEYLFSPLEVSNFNALYVIFCTLMPVSSLKFIC